MANDERDHIDAFLEVVARELPDLDLDVEGIVDRVGSLNRRFRRMMEATLAEHGLALGEWAVLNALRQSGPPYRRSPGQLAKRLELTSGAMTARLDRLEEDGLIRRRPEPEDRRGVQVELTAAGRRAYERSTGAQAEKEALVAAALTKREKDQLNRLLRRLLREFERVEGADPKDHKAG